MTDGGIIRTALSMPARVAIVTILLAVGARIIAAAAAPAEQGPDAQAATAPAGERSIEHFGQRLAAAEAIGLQQAGPFADRVLYLMDGPGDAAHLRALAEESLRQFESLRRDLEAAIEEARTDWEKLAVGLPVRLEALGRQADLRAAWVRLYLAAALAAGAGPGGLSTEAQHMLDAAIQSARPLLEDQDAPTRLGAALLCGMALSQQGQADQARPLLESAAHPAAPARLRPQGLFELAKLYAQQGQWDQAGAQIEEFARVGRQLLGEAAAADIDLHQAFFLHHLLLQRARREAGQDFSQAQEFSRQAQQVLSDALRRYPQRLAAAAPLVGRRYADRQDLSALQTPIVFAVGMAALAASPPDRARGAGCFEQVLARAPDEDEVFHAPALWHLAVSLHALGSQSRRPGEGWALRHQAAGRFSQLARQYGADPMAQPAARNAVSILHGRLSALSGHGEAVPELRGELIAALELLLDRWGDQEEVRPYVFMLARQYDLAGQWEPALVWYTRVLPSWPEHLTAWSNALLLRRRTLAELPTPQQAVQAEALAADLRQFAAAARDAAERAETASQGDRLLALAAESELRIADVLTDELGSPTRAMAHLQDVERRWPAHQGLLEQVQAMRVEILLEQGQTAQAVQTLRAFQARHGKAGQATVSRVAFEIREHLRELDGPGGQQEPVQAWHEAFREFAEQAFAASGGQPDYACRQMLAEAWTETGRSEDALAIFQELHEEQADDARNLQGMARCHWLAGRHLQAVALYQRLSEGLSPQREGPLWWRIQLDMARCIHQGARGRPDALARLQVRIRQLEAVDRSLGGYRRQFDVLREGTAEH